MAVVASFAPTFGCKDPPTEHEPTGVRSGSVAERSPTSMTDRGRLEVEPRGETDVQDSPPPDCLQAYDGQPRPVPGPEHLRDGSKLSVVAAYMDDDAWPDLVITTGGHEKKGHVFVLFGPIRDSEEPVSFWMSEVEDHFAGLSIGDIDGNGTLDIAASVFSMDGNQEVSSRVFLAEGSRRWQPGPVQPWNSRSATVALGDANGDGRLDLFVGAIDLDGTTPLLTARQRLYINRGSPPYYGGDAIESTPGVDTLFSQFVDAEGDGKLDVAASQAGLTWGVAYTGGSLDEPTFLQCGGEPNRGFNVQLAPFHDATGRTEFAVTTSTHYCSGVFCRDRIFTQAWQTCDASWEANVGDMMPVAVRVADLDGNEAIDVLASFWTGEGPAPAPGPIGAYCAGSTERSTELTPLGTATFRSHALALSDLDRKGIATKVEQWSPDTRPVPDGATALTLASPVIERVTKVVVGETTIRPLVVPGSNWVGVPHPLTSKDTVTVTYEVSDSLDIIVADYSVGDVPVFYKD